MAGSNDSATLYKISLDPEWFLYSRSSEKAECWKIDDKIVWIPRSQIKERKQENKKVIMVLPFWLVREKGLEDYIDTSDAPTLFDMRGSEESDQMRRLKSEQDAEDFHYRGGKPFYDEDYEEDF